METITLKTKCGDVTGIRTEEGNIFQGIPYATAERFELPVPVTDFGGTFDATEDPVEFPQLNTYEDDSENFYTKEFRPGKVFRYAESPLTLNIITPADADDCPVLIYIHGGAFMTGKMSDAPCGTSTEYARRGIILVSIGYRLNVFGMYRCENYYLYDQLCAIKWVRDNIADYGGNSRNITLIGQSAGAMSIFQLMFTDCLKGIVKRAVLMSGAGFFPSFADGFEKEQGRPFWDSVMTEAGCENDEELKKVSAETLWKAWNETKKKHGSIHMLQPGIDGTMIPCQPSEIRKSGKMLDIPLMVGVTSQDMFAPVAVFNMARKFALWSEKHGRKPVYTYYFDRVLPGKKYAAYHASDLWYMFGNMDESWRFFTWSDRKLKDIMVDSVVKFIRCDNPGWKPFTSENRMFRRFDIKGPSYVSPWDCHGELLKNTLVNRGPF